MAQILVGKSLGKTSVALMLFFLVRKNMPILVTEHCFVGLLAPLRGGFF